MKYPKYLKQNDTIGFTAPSFGCTIEPYMSGFNEAIERFKGMGYKVRIGDNCYKSDGIGISTNPKDCAKELEEMYKEADSDVLISCGGGELMCETIGNLDFEGLKEAEPKWFMGYSDNTNFTFLLNTILDTASIYAPCAASYGMRPWHKALKSSFGVLTGEVTEVEGYNMWELNSSKTAEKPFEPYNLTEEKIIYLYEGNNPIFRAPTCEEIESGNVKKGHFKTRVNFEGRIIGGCLDTLVTLCGTRFDKVKEFNEKYKDDGIVWFLESCDLTPLQIRRACWQLRNAGWFDNARGFVFGRPYHFHETDMGVDQYNAVLGVIGDMNKYIVFDADIGHLSPSIPVISGSYAKISVGENINIKYELI